MSSRRSCGRCRTSCSTRSNQILALLLFIYYSITHLPFNYAYSFTMQLILYHWLTPVHLLFIYWFATQPLLFMFYSITHHSITPIHSLLSYSFATQLLLSIYYSIAHLPFNYSHSFTVQLLRPLLLRCCPPYPRQSLRRGRQTSISSQGSGFQKWKEAQVPVLHEFTASNTPAWLALPRGEARKDAGRFAEVWSGLIKCWPSSCAMVIPIN